MQTPQFVTYLRKTSKGALLACALGVILAQPALADPEDAVDPVARVGRVAWIAGTVRLDNPQTGESFPVSVNQPLTSGDVLHTERGARAEIQIGSATLRLDGQSELVLAQIDDTRIRLQLADGGVIARLPSRETLDDFELSTRDGRFLPRATGLYRFDTDARSTVATTYDGNLQAESGRNMTNVEPGQGMQFWDAGDAARGSAYRVLAAANDEFRQWSDDRDRQSYAARRSAPYASYARYVSPEMTGAADLDTYGDWAETPEYGAIWQPRRVSSDWAPYRDGHWVWVDPWGWNWVGDEPWGFAPFHYGRWVRYRGAWAWVPGERVQRPVYAPAMVAWVGSAGAGLSFSFGWRTAPPPRTGWFPLAPHEVYVPAFRSSPRYVQDVNRTHVTRIENVTVIANHPEDAMRRYNYRNRDVPQAVTRLPESAWRRPPPTARSMPGPLHREPAPQRNADDWHSVTRRIEAPRPDERRPTPAAVLSPVVRESAPPSRTMQEEKRPEVRTMNVPAPSGSDTRDSRRREMRDSPATRSEQPAARVVPEQKALAAQAPAPVVQPVPNAGRVEIPARLARPEGPQASREVRSEPRREVKAEPQRDPASSAERRAHLQDDRRQADEDWRKKKGQKGDEQRNDR